MKDIPELKKEIRQLKKQIALLEEERNKLKLVAEYDFLTGVYNRHGFVHEAERFLHEMKAERRLKGKRRIIVSNLSILFIDVDDLKKINDKFGHNAGDRYLKSIGNALIKSVREIDMVGRWGGDEFAVALVNTTDAEAYAVAQKLQLRVSKIKLGKTVGDFVCSASIGLISADGVHGSKANYDIHTLIERADKAMYVAKKEKGKGMIVSLPEKV